MWEGNFTTVRCSPEGYDTLLIILDNLKLEFEERGVWQDRYIEAEHRQFFGYIFHGYSELAMCTLKDNNKDFLKLMDRIFHIACNNFRTPDRIKSLESFMGRWSDRQWEPMLMYAIGSIRSFVIGNIYRSNMIELKEDE
jgi:hypothetical protein